jgi:hypothetical protein
MKTRYLADSLGLPPDWQAERYSTTIELIGPNGLKGRIVLPQEGTIDGDYLKNEAAKAVKEATDNQITSETR